MKSKVFYASKDVVIAGIDRALILICKNDVSEISTAGLSAFVDSFVQDHPGGMAFLTVVEQGSKPPDGPTRQVMASFLKRDHDRIRCSAVVVEGTGFQPAMVRSVTTGLSMLVRTPFPYEVHTLNGAVALLERCLGEPFDSETFLQAFQKLRTSVS